MDLRQDIVKVNDKIEKLAQTDEKLRIENFSRSSSRKELYGQPNSMHTLKYKLFIL